MGFVCIVCFGGGLCVVALWGFVCLLWDLLVLYFNYCYRGGCSIGMENKMLS